LKTSSSFPNLAIIVVCVFVCTNVFFLSACANKETSEAQNIPALKESADLPGFPQPDIQLKSSSLVGIAQRLSRNLELGEKGQLVFKETGDTLSVILCGVAVNCCTESMKFLIDPTEHSLDVMLYEYLPDVCECFNERDIFFKIFPIPEKGTLIRVSANDRNHILGKRRTE